jgi:hypothetical protein
MHQRAFPHRAILGEGVAAGLPLEAQGVEDVACRRQLTVRINEHQVHDALAGTAGHGRAADVLYHGTSQVQLDQGRDLPGDLGGSWVVLLASRRAAFVGPDGRLDPHVVCPPCPRNTTARSLVVLWGDEIRDI